MNRELVIAIPGPWKDRAEFLSCLVATTKGELMFVGNILANPKAKDHIAVELYEADSHMQEAFEYAGQGKLKQSTIKSIAEHKMTAYLRFPLSVSGEQARMRMFTSAIRKIGGIAVKIESSGTAHEWEVWDEILDSTNPFDLYHGFVTLIGGEGSYYSCGMHHFGMPESQVPRSLEIQEAADLLNRFNYYRMVENPELKDGHTFSLPDEHPGYRLRLLSDPRHDSENLFHNPYGVWDMEPVEQGTPVDAPKSARH